MLSFEEFKKRKTQSTNAASEGQQKQSTGSNKVLSFEEWKAQRNNQTQEPEQKTSLFDSSKIDRYIRDANNFLETSNKELQGMTYQNAGSQYTSKLKQSEDLKNRGFEISQYLNQYRDELDDKYVHSVKNAIKEIDGASKQAMANFLDSKQYYSQWESEDDYNAYLAQLQDYEDKSRYDIDAGQKEIEALEEQLKQLTQAQSNSSSVNGMPYAIGQQAVYSEEYAPAANNVNGMPYAAYQQAMYAPVDNQAAELRDEILRKKQYLNQAKQIQRKIAFESAAGNKDFAQKSVYIAGVDDVLYNWINDEQFRNEYAGMRNDGTKKSKFEINKYGLMTEDEVKLYNYYYATEGAEKAQEYLDTIQEDLNKLSGKQIADKYKGKTGAEIFFGVATGLDQFGSGMRGAVSGITGTEDYIPQSQLQYAGQFVREDLADSGGFLAQGAYDLVSTISNMAPSILASAVLSPVAGSALMGTSAAGNAYQTALNSGYDKNAARSYGVAIGVAETAMQSLLGGISSLGGISPAVTKAVEGIDKGMLRFFARYGASMASEGLEEGLQEVLDPILQNAILGADENVDWANVVYSALLGAASAGVLEIGGNIRKVRQESAAKAEYGNKTDELLAEGLSYDAGTEANEIAQQYKARVDSGKSMTGAQIKHQLEANEVQRVETAAKDRLVELGETDNPAEIAKLATKRAMGAALKPAEKSRLARSKFGAQVAKELVPENAAKGKLVDAMTRPGKYKPLDTRVETDVTGRVSESGKNELADSGAEFDLKQIDAKTGNDGKLVWTVDGQEATADNIKFKDEDTAYIFEAVEQIENITPTAAPVLIRSVDTSKNVIKQLNGLDEAYTYGFYNYSLEDLKAGEFSTDLTQTQMMDAYRLGEAARARATGNVDASKVNLRTAEQKAEQVKKRMITDDTEVYFADGSEVVKFDQHKHKYDDKRMAGVNAAKFLSKMGIGGKFYFYESYMKNGVRVYKNASGAEVPAPNGIFKAVDGSIYIDMNAGNKGEGTTLFTMGHELTHFVKANSEKQFKRLADLVKEAYDNTEVSLHQRVINKQETLSKIRNEHVSYDEAYEEVVADAMSTMMTDGSLYEKLAELRSTDKGLFNTIKRFFDEMIAKFKKVYESLAPDQQDAQDIREMKDMFDRIQNAFAEALVEASDNFSVAMESVVEAKADPVPADQIITDGAVVTDANGEKYSIRSMKADIAEGKMFEDLEKVCGWTDAQVNELRNQLNDLVEYMIPYRDVLDMNESYGREGRRFSPYKPNSDPLYKISMDFSTLCSKRLLTQYVIENLQLRENRPMSAEEQMAIRAMLNEYRKVEKGLQVACAMCYVEAARLKSPNQIQKWMDDPATAMRNYFADKNAEFAAYIKEKQADFKESKGYDRDATKKDMKPKDRTELNKIRPRLREQYQPSAEEQAIIDRAKTLPNSTYLTAGNLANLSETDPTIYSAYTAFVRTATRSKSLETDEPYYYGDSTRDNGNGIVVTDSFIEAVNRENGMRFSSWSDWRIQHLLDYITAVIDNSVRGSAMHGYTKFGEEVRVLGKTGMMFNMSGVAGTQNGLNVDGSLNFSDTESIDVNEAIQLRDEFPETAGLQCIGVGDAHITALLRSDIIDYVIPYHVSGLNAALRRMADIHGWKDYTSTQHAAIDKSIKFENAADQEHWHEEPVYSEFFVGYDTGMTGIEAMKASAEKYKQMCKDRGLTPKFNQFASEENYWKLLIDRKMINQQTGKLIQQKAVTPSFDFSTIKEVVDRHVQNYDAGLEKRALNHIVENWDTIPQRIKDLKKQGGIKAKQTKKSMDTLANQTVAAQPKDGVKKSDRFDGLSPSKYNALLHKKPINASEKDLAKVNEARMREYSRLEESDIPDLDIFSLAEYGKLNEGYLYFVRNYGKDSFVIVGKKQIIPAKRNVIREERTAYEERNSRKKTHSNDVINGSGRRIDAGYIERSGDRSELRENDDGTGWDEKSVQKSDTWNGTSNRRSDVKRSDRYNTIASDFTSHMVNIVKTNRGWYAKDVFKYVEEHPEVGFIELIYAKDKDVKQILEKFLNGVDDVDVLNKLSWYMGEAYGDKGRTWNPYDGATYPYRGAVRTFRNAVKKRINTIMTERVGGTNLGVKNGESSLADIKDMYSKLNSNEEMKQFAEKVFSTAEKLGVNIRFVNQTLSKQQVAGDNLGDMVEYKTSYFNDTTVTDQHKANTILHELIHACTVYVMDANKTMGDVGWNKSENYNRISNAATRLNRIYFEISYDSAFQGQYGIKNAKEMVAELANPEFVGLLKKKNLWDNIVDWICELFGFRRGNSAYDNARMCVDYILDNPEVSEYKDYANKMRNAANRKGMNTFGQTRYSDRDYVAYDRRAILKESKVEEYLYDYAAKSSPKYAQAYIAYVRPRTFLKLTTDDVFERYHIADQAGELDEERLSNSRPGIYLRIDHETGQITGHEGRHRMSAMDSAGIELVPVLLVDTSNKMTKTDIAEITLHGQFDETAMGIVNDLIPLNYENRDRVIKNFATQSSTQRIGERYGFNKTLRFSERTEDSVSNRHLLANAFEGISRSSVEYGMIQDYKRNIDKLNKLEEQLSDVNAEIRQLRFGKDVERDPERLRELEEKADGLAKEINKYDKRLINMEASEPLRKVLDRERKKVRQKTIEHTKQIQQNRKLRKEQTELRKRIRRTIMDLDKILNKGDKKRNVKDGLRAFVDQAIKATDVLFMDDVKPYDMLRAGFTAALTESEKAQVEEARKMLDELDEIYGQSNEQNPAKDPEFVAAEARLDAKIAEMSDIFERENMAREETTVSGVISKIMIEYKKLEKSPQIEVRNAYSDAVYEHMGQLAEVIGDTRIKDMSVDQLQNLYQMYSWVKAKVTMANKFFADNIKQSVKDMAFQSVTEFKRAEAQRKKDKRTEAVYAVLDKIGWNNEKVMYALRRMDNSVITTLMQNIINGEDVTMRDVQEAIEFRKGVEKKYNYKKWDFDKTYTFEDKHGEEFEMNLHQMLSFYAYSRREAARDHIARGGIVVKANTVLKRDSTDAHAISEEGIAQIESALTEEQRAYVREMQSYLSDVMGAKGNEVSLKLYGIKMFNEETYFPIRSSSAYLSKAGEADLKAQIGITNMASAGFTKSLVPHAATPIELGDFLDVWANHVNEMSRYHGFVLPMEDFRRVFNFSSYATDESSTAVRASMENAFGKQAVKYFDDLYRDLNSGASADRSNEKIVRKWFSRFKKNAVMYSLSVVVQQPTAIVRAGAMIDKKYFGFFGYTGKIATGMVRLFSKNHTKLWNEMLEYAPGVTTIKEIGGFDTATGGSILSALKEETYENASEHWNEFTKHPLKWTSHIADNNILSKIPAYADQIAWVEIWNAVKRETLAANRNMTPNSKEHLELVGKRFSEVIRMTQVYDSVFAKSPLMRSQSLTVQMLTSFMSEPNTTINMVEDGVREMARGRKRAGARILWSVAAAVTFNNLIKSVVYAMRDDDEDQNFKEKYLESVIGGMTNDMNILNYIPIARDVWSIAQGYDVERADMTLISDLADNLTRVTKLSQKDTSEMDDDQLAAHEKAQLAAYMAMVDSIGALIGFPIKNIRRDVKGFINTFLGNKVGESTKLSLAYTVEQAWNEALPTMLRPETTPKTDVLYETIMAGDATYLNRLKNGYKDEKAYTTAVRKALRENDPRVAEAAQALYENNASEYKRLYQQIRAENKFSAADILSAIDSEASALKKDTEGESKSAPYSASDFVKATVVGDSATAKAMLNEYIAFMVSSGMSRDDAVKKFQQSVYNSVSDSFHNGMLTRNTAKKLLVDHSGKSADEAEDRITYWEFTKKYPQYDLSESAVLDYYDIAEPLGISINNYAKFAKAKGGKRDEILTVIDSLDLSNDQKDALYFMTGLAESKLWDTPWH